MKSISVFYDSSPRNPRYEDCNFAHFALDHNRLNVGDKNSVRELSELIKDSPNFREKYHNEYNLMHLPDLEDLGLKMGVFAIHMPVYAYQHGGLSISLTRTGQFADRFDSGKLGFIYVTKQDIRDNFVKKYVTSELIEKSKSIILSEFEEYKSFVEGDTFSFKIYADEEKEVVEDSMHGFIGLDVMKNGMLDYVDEDLTDQLKQIFEERSFEY